MKIAQFKHLCSNYEYTLLLDQESAYRSPEVYTPTQYIRLTEWVDVTFIPRAAEDTAREQLDALDVAESELRRKFAEKLDQIATERAKLRVITHDAGSAK